MAAWRSLVAIGSILARFTRGPLCKSGIVVHTCNLSTLGVKAGRSAQGQPGLEIPSQNPRQINKNYLIQTMEQGRTSRMPSYTSVSQGFLSASAGTPREPLNLILWFFSFQRLTKSQVSGIGSGHLHLSYLQIKPHSPIYFFLLIMSSQSSPQTLSISRKGMWLFIPILLLITMHAQKNLTWDYKMAQVLRAFFFSKN